MGTRAIYIFEDEHEEVWAYKHYDNYPRGAANFIEDAKEYAWEFPRFEADEFAAAFVAANKNPKGGEVRLINALFKDRDEMLEAHEWNDYYYVISYQPHHRDLWVEIWQMRDTWNWVLMDELTHTQMKEKYCERAVAV